MKKMMMLMSPEDSWFSGLPDGLKGDPNITKYKSVEELARGHTEAVKLIGSSIRPLGQNATPEEKKAFVERLLQAEPALIYAPDGDEEASKRLFKKLGRPDRPEEYKFDEQAVTAAGLNPSDLRSLAVTAGLTQQQAASLAKVMVDANMEVKRVTTLEQQALDQKWGAAKEERTLTAKAAALKMGLNEREISTLTPKELESWYNVGKAIGVSQNEFRQNGFDTKPRLTPDEIDAEMNAIRAKPAYFNPHTNPAEHKQLVARMTELTVMRG